MNWRELSAAELHRLKLSLLHDLLIGLAQVTPRQRAEVVPTSPPPRPQLRFEASGWPPIPGRYDGEGLGLDAVTALGTLAQAFTFDEVRAFLVGLAQATAPSKRSTRQVWRAANALTEVLLQQEKSQPDYVEVWADLFGSGGRRLSFTGESKDNAPLVLGRLALVKPSVYVIRAICMIRKADGSSGSIAAQATLSATPGGLRLEASHRRLAQLNSNLYGVSFDIGAIGQNAEFVVRGLPGASITWECVGSTLRSK